MHTLFIALIIFAVVWPLLRYAAYLISNLVAGTLSETRRRQKGLLLPLLRSWGTAILADCMVFPSYPLGFFTGNEPLGRGTPILFVHGLFHNGSAWRTMIRRFRKAGFSNLHTYQYNSFSGDFPTAVEGLRQRMDELLRHSPTGKIALVGHSLGGLVCRTAAGDPRHWDRVAALVALGTPHGGSDLARFAMNTMGRGLIPGAEIMEIADSVVPAKCPKLAIYNYSDDYVFPLKTLIPPNQGWEERLCSPMGHVWMLYSNEITGMLIEYFRKLGLDGEE
ncbi:alpha/beta fold hydrolase [Pseudodesulfovibrio sp. zrk46]|uniref:esterase/lipase family protein n=1 Tax=Pseudodesulfovibrio sp. zrk46 TaxID=2725288 RepID=UPI0014498EA0|nr:alpha/beta fold hydrolase [Pseudodesulfovibrio sp. zrk46]QJB56522.1 alpha/beta fold hydrolase [Pseudodesulfovibrio sp. zrk46]